MDDNEMDDVAGADNLAAEETPPASHRQEHRSGASWSDPSSPLEAARFALRRSRTEVVAAVRHLCPGHNGQPCTLDATKLAQYEHNERRPGAAHVAVLSRYYNLSPKELGLSTSNPQPASSLIPDPAGRADVLGC